MRDTRNPYENRRAKIVIGRSALDRFLDLPDTLTVVSVYGTADPAAVCVVVEGAHLDQQPEHSELPSLRGVGTPERVVFDGKVFTRWGFRPDLNPDAVNPQEPTAFAAPLLEGTWSVVMADDRPYLHWTPYAPTRQGD